VYDPISGITTIMNTIICQLTIFNNKLTINQLSSLNNVTQGQTITLIVNNIQTPQILSNLDNFIIIVYSKISGTL